MTTHRAQGQRVVYVDGEHIVAVEGKTQHKIALADVPITHNGSIGFQVDNVMAAVGAAWASDIDWDVIRAGLKSFSSDSDNAPGRFNMFDYRGATVIADYGHNPDAISALIQAIDSIPSKRRSLVISGAGDRRNEDIRQQGTLAGEAFDDVFLYQDQCQRGREDGEVMRLLRDGLEGAPRTSHIEEIRGEFIAIDRALGNLGSGDLCLVLIDQVEEALAYIAKRVAEA
jgi:cyanophycin synthetase